MFTTRMESSRRMTAWASVAASMLLLAVTNAHAVPSMGRQTGYECSKCHTVYPELTPYGRAFKLGGFTNSSAKWDEKPLIERLPVSAVLQASRTSTSDIAAGGASADEFPQDRKTIVQAAGLYWGGKVTDNIGALIQYNYDGIEKKWGMEMFDARYANSTSVADKELVWGVTLNNNPTVSDIYASTPQWAFPNAETASPVRPVAAAVDMTLASQVGGVGAYGLWNDLVYVELAGYTSARKKALRALALSLPIETVLNGTAPYWRLALQQRWDAHNVAVGTYGLVAKLAADPDNPGAGSNRFRDVAFDANYQYIEGDHTASAHVTSIREKRTWTTSFAQGLTSNPDGTLKTLRADVLYHFQRKWGGGLQYFQTRGSSDDLLYNTGDALFGSASGSPNSKGYVAQLNYLPWNNLKLSLRYTAYTQFSGAKSDYMPGRSASDNNSLHLLAWLMF